MAQPQRIRITKRFTLEMAHALHGHDGACANIHGHSYILEVTLLGVPLNEPGHPKDGMVMDFADLKAMVKREVLDRYDHALLISELDAARVPQANGPFGALRVVPWQPSCENILVDIVGRLMPCMPARVELMGIRLWETATSHAEWWANDQSSA
jgi:6-pyruvoyltetrahydropterin/6-carboxytetrahydropterin synthase